MSQINVTQVFGNFNFQSIANNPDFKEDSVRETIILPLLQTLGYGAEQIVRSKSLRHPYLKVGSKQRHITLVPDYLLKIESSYAWVLDAKSPREKIISSDNVEQVFGYAIHSEVRAKYFALCNGTHFALYRTQADNDTPILFFALQDIEKNWELLHKYLAPASFHEGKRFIYKTPPLSITPEKFDYLAQPLLPEMPVKKQAAKRHFGVHGYFTKQSWNVVNEYIKHFSQEGDLVLDPFGGSGVTAVEAMMRQRRAIHIDLNPMAVFLVEALVAPVNINELNEAFESVQQEYLKKEPKDKKAVEKILANYPQIKPLALPKGSDVQTVDALFTDKQRAQLSLLKYIIKKQRNENIRKSLLLVFSSTITKINRTYHNSKSRNENSGNASVFAYYRYRIAHENIALNVMNSFTLKYQKLLSAKKDIEYFINADTISNLQIIKGTATDLSFIANESVDYIYTDPPYGKKIPYLDLSVMWNAWLDLEVSETDYAQEAIEGGKNDKSKSEYNDLISKSIEEMYRVLKFDRWMSFVFAHKDPAFFHLITETAERCGFEYVGAVSQKNGQTSFKKRQNAFTVLAGQLILNFKKVRNPRTMLSAHLGMEIADVVMQTMEGVIAKEDGATLEQINDELIIKGLELGFLDLLKKEYSDLTPILLERFDYDTKTKKFTIRKDAKFTSHIDLNLRIRYYVLSFLRRMERENKRPTFDEIIMHTIPLLKNGITPEEQNVESVLKDIAQKETDGRWQLKKQRSLFDELNV